VRVLVTGGRGFVGQWLERELGAAGHEVRAPGRDDLDVTDGAAVAAALRDASIEAVAHLAGVSFAADAAADPVRALRVNLGGTIALLEAVRAQARPPVVLVAGSSDVYAPPGPGEALAESSPLGPRTPYGLTKVAQESAALAYAARHRLRIVVTRPFNHAGPGQRTDFVIPALARRVRAVRDAEASTIPVGNLESHRDFTHVADVVRAYRSLLEGLAAGRFGEGGIVVNVASGRSVSIGEILAGLCRRAGVDPMVTVDPALLRANEPPEIRGDASLLRSLIGWAPVLGVEDILDDVWSAAAQGGGR
jgi:GDP-4-dehydro-6-deoxy-D-mannose reductase